MNNMDLLDSPYDWGLPHQSWRPNQLDALQKVLEVQDTEETKKVVILELPTGSGKSGIATALGKDQKVVVFVHSLALLDQYRDKYNFVIVKGMEQYECNNLSFASTFRAKRNRMPRVSECPYDKMTDCPVYEECFYIEAREAALASRRMACTYPFALLSYKVAMRTGIGIWDECHSAVDAIIQLSSVGIDNRFREEWGLSQFPARGTRDALVPATKGLVLNWFKESIKTIYERKPSPIFMDDVAIWQAGLRKLCYGLDAIDQSNDWYFESWFEERKTTFKGREEVKQIPYMLFKPFSAARFSGKLLKNKTVTVLMSATVGNPEPLAKELGIETYQFYDYPHPVPKEKRPVYDLKFERMIWDNITRYPLLFKLQALRIAEFIKEMPEDWRGVITCASYSKANSIREALEPLIGDRLFVPDAGKGNSRVQQFLDSDKKGLVVVDVVQVWGQGLSLDGDLGRFMIIESVPFGNLSDNYEIVRRKQYGSEYAWWVSYTSVVQACGRVSRGEVENDGSFLLNVCALADGSATSPKALKSYSNWFKESIVPFHY